MRRAITVVGGAYGEECSFPMRQVLRGSGGRAAALLSSLGAQVTLATITGPELGSEFTNIAKYLGYKLDARPGTQDIWFRYRYPQAHPIIYPAPIVRIPNQRAICSNVALAFGMIEGRLPLRAERAVYDPQDGSAAKPFDSNGSVAEDLGIVLSVSEGVALTGETDPVAIGRKLLRGSRTSVAVVKCGPRGSLVHASRSHLWVPPFPTSTVFKIGSGDVFSAAFAYAWLIERQPPITAAWFASRMVAAYVESSRDRFNSDEIRAFRAEAQAAQHHRRKNDGRNIPRAHIYLAGPFFNASQQWLVDEVREALLEMGFRVFSPIHDVGIGEPHEVAPANLAALDKSGLLLALLDGVDSGTIFEVGYARAKKIPVVAIAESVDAAPLTMILGSGCYVTNDVTTGIYAACWHLMGDV